MSKIYYSRELNRNLEVPDDFTIEQVMAWEDELRGDRGILNKAAGFTRGLLPGAIQGAAGMVEGIGGLTNSDTLKSVASGIRDNPVSKYLIERPIQDEDNIGRTAGELVGNIATMFTPGGAARVAGATPRVAAGLSTLAGIAQSAGEATGEVRRNREQGMEITPEQETLAAWKAAPLGTLDALPLGRYLGRIDDFGGRKLAQTGLGTLLGRSAVTGGIEGITEGAQQVGLNAVERGYNPEQALNEGLLESMQAGGGAGWVIDMGLSLLGKRVAMKGARNIERAKGESPAIPDDGIAGIGIRRGASGEADISAIRAAEPPATISADTQTVPVQQSFPDATLTDNVVTLLPGLNDSPDAAPVEAPTARPPKVQAMAKVARGYSVPVTYAVVPIGSLRISNDDVGQINPNYPQELQPRQRDRKSSDEQVGTILANLDPEQLGENYFASDGAPIVGKDYAVESGNGRSMALRRAYATNPEKAEAYKNWLTANAGRFGVTPEQIASVKNPVLVRVRQGLPEGVSRTDFARDANEDTKAQMSAGEQAIIDSRTMSNDIVSMFKPNENGDIVTRDNAQFITRFFDEVVPQGQRGAMRLPDGTISKAGIDRIRNAVFARAYNDRGIVERLAEDPDDNIKNVVGALTTAAPRMIWMRSGIDSGDFFDLNPSQEITAAASRLAHLREVRMPVQDYLNQMTFDPRDPMEDAILSVFGTYGRSKTDIAEILNDYVSAVQAVGNPKQEGMFGPTEPPSKMALLGAIIEAKQQRDAEAKQKRAEKQAGGLDAAGGPAGLGPSTGRSSQDAGSKNYSLAEKDLSNYPAYTVRSLTRQLDANTNPQIALDLFNELKRINMDDLVSTKLVDGIVTEKGDKVYGSYRDKLITLSLEAADKKKLVETLNHEAIHAMKKIGMFTDAEWNILQAALKPELVMSDEQRDAYAKYFKGDTARMNEESIARGFEAYVAGKMPLPKPATGIIAKTINALNAIGVVARKQTASDIIRDQQSGKVGARFVPTDAPAAPVVKLVNTDPTVELIDEIGDDAPPELSIFTPQDQAQFDRLFPAKDNRSFAQKLKETYEDYRKPARKALTIDSFSARNRQQGLDRRYGIEKLSQQSANQDADASAIAATRFADMSGNVATAVLTKGHLEMVGTAGRGWFQASDADDGIFRKGGALAKLQQAGKLDAMFWAAGAERAAELMAEGKEKRFTPADIARGKQFMKDPEIAAGVKELKTHFDYLVDSLTKSGMITEAVGKRMKSKAYFPFYRIMEDQNGNIVARGFDSQETLIQAPPGGGLGLGNLAALHKLKGSDNPVADPIENIARNTFAITSLAMRNVAAQRIMRDGKALGYIKQVASDKVGGDVVKTWINGKPRYFQVLDKVLYDSVQASGIEVGSLMKLIGVGPAKFLRDMVTSDPVFMVKNALRDSTQLWMQGYSSAPFVNIAGGLRKALTNAESYDTLQRMGVIGTGVRGEGMDETASNLKGELGNHGLAKRFNEQRKRALAGSEAIGRITVYDAVRNRGGSPAQAAYEALELLNFNRKGASPFIQWVSALTPFLNAHAQGTDVIYRTMRGKSVGGKAQQRQLAMRGLALAGLTAAYALMSQGEDYYENSTGEERDLYWFVPIPGTKEAFKIPTPFELALPFKVLPEHLVNLTVGDELSADAKKAAGRAIVSVFGIQPPQTMKPLLEGMVNYDLFRQRNIEPESMKRLEPQMRHDDYTAELSKALGKVTGYSPMQVDHLLKGYAGSMGVLALNLVDSLLERNGPEVRPFSQPSTLPVGLGRMFQREGGGRMLVDFYELRDIAEQAVATQRAMTKQGIQDTPANIQKRAQRAAVAKATEGMDDAIAKLRKYRKWVNATDDLTPATKRDALNEIRRREIEITKQAQPLRRAVQ